MVALVLGWVWFHHTFYLQKAFITGFPTLPRRLFLWQKMISVDHLDALEQKRPQRHAWDSHTNALIRSIAVSFSYKICLALGQLNRPWRLLLGGTSPSAIKTASHLPKLHLWQEYCASSTQLPIVMTRIHNFLQSTTLLLYDTYVPSKQW